MYEYHALKVHCRSCLCNFVWSPEDEVKCPHCGGKNLELRGFVVTRFLFPILLGILMVIGWPVKTATRGAGRAWGWASSNNFDNAKKTAAILGAVMAVTFVLGLIVECIRSASISEVEIIERMSPYTYRAKYTHAAVPLRIKVEEMTVVVKGGVVVDVATKKMLRNRHEDLFLRAAAVFEILDEAAACRETLTPDLEGQESP